MATETKISRRPMKFREAGWAKGAAEWLARIGVRPNQISISSVVFAGLAAGTLVAAGKTAGVWQGVLFLVATMLILLRMLCNLFDGMVAVEGGFRTKSGEIFNELPDRFSDAAILVGAGYAVSAGGMWQELGWLAGILSVITAYVRALGGSCGASQSFVGPMAKPQRMGVMVGVCVLMGVLGFIGKPMNLMHPALGVVCVGCLVTIARRARQIVRELEAK